MDLALRRRLRIVGRRRRRIIILRQRNDKFALIARGRRAHVVFQQPRVAICLFCQAAFLVRGRLEEKVEVAAVAGHGEAFEALVVVAPRRIVGGVDVVAGAVVDVVRWGVGGKGLAAVAHRDDGVVGADGVDHFAGAREVVDVGSVFVRDPEGAVVIEDEAFAVEGDALAEDTLVATAEAVAGVGGYGQVGEAWIGEVATSICIEPGAWCCSIWAIEEDGLKICEDEIRARGIGNRGMWLGGKRKIEPVNPWLYI